MLDPLTVNLLVAYVKQEFKTSTINDNEITDDDESLSWVSEDRKTSPRYRIFIT